MDLISMKLMMPELILTGLIFIFLFVRLGSTGENNKPLLMAANVLLLINLVVGFCCDQKGTLFDGMYYTDSQLILQKNVLNLALLLVSLLAYEWLLHSKNAAEFYMLLLTAQLGMFFLISSTNFLMFFLAMELATIPLSALSNFDLDKPKSAEAAFKSIMSGAFASGIMLFGISLLYGTTGTLDFREVMNGLDGIMGTTPIQVMAFVFVFVGLAFKLSLVPFHLWTADVYEGSPVSITATLAVISKGTFVFVLAKALFVVFAPLFEHWEKLLTISIIMTICVGNFMAVRQNNLKRLLAFSSIAQMGYLLLGVVSGSTMGTVSIVYFMIIYICSSLAMFAVVSAVFYKTGKDDVSDYRGFYQNNKVLSWVIALALFSLAGIPPTAGFFGKYFLLTYGAMRGDYILLGVASLNMIVSLYYYLRVVKAIFIDKSETPMEKIKMSNYATASIVICMIGILVIGFFGDVFEYVSNHFLAQH